MLFHSSRLKTSRDCAMVKNPGESEGAFPEAFSMVNRPARKFLSEN